MFTINNSPRNGFQITFQNGYTVSVQFGRYNYCSNQGNETEPLTHCEDAEVALVHPNGWLIDLFGKLDWWNYNETVNGYTTPDQLAELIAYAQALPAR